MLDQASDNAIERAMTQQDQVNDLAKHLNDRATHESVKLLPTMPLRWIGDFKNNRSAMLLLRRFDNFTLTQ